MLHGQHRAAGWSNKAHFSSPSSCVSVCVCVCVSHAVGQFSTPADDWLLMEAVIAAL